MSAIGVIMAGGKGTRIAAVRNDIPKPMIEVCERPVLSYQIECLKENGITEIVIVTGHLGNVIQKYFGDGRKEGVNIRYIQEESPLGTAGALYFLKGVAENIILINGDIIFNVNLLQMLDFHQRKKAEVTLFAHPNSHPYDSTLLIRNTENQVTGLQKTVCNTVRNCVNAGIHIISSNVLRRLEEPKPLSMDNDIIKAWIPTGKVYAYISPEYVRDMGTPQRYKAVCRDMQAGIVHARNLKHKQKAVFLDRDGTVNTYKGFITHPDQISLEEDAAWAIRQINKSGYLAVIITNQPVIARGECTISQLEAIHGRLEYLLGREGAYIDDIFYCPHHPERGFEGENVEYKKLCDCRKPQPGLLLKAAQTYNIDLSNSYMIGDSICDIQAAHAAGCKAVGLRIKQEFEEETDAVFQKLSDAVNDIFYKCI